MTNESTYIPGTCNIGKAEVQMRKNIMWLSGIVSAVFVAAGLWLHWPFSIKALLFIPLATLILTAQQVYRRFCVAFGLKGLFNFEAVGKVHTAQNAEYLKKDRARAWQIILLSIFSAGLLTMLYTFL